jgi:hypothetical protein
MRQLSPKHLSEQEKQMTTTAFDDQFTAGTQPLEPVRQPYDIAPILRRNIADIEIALKRQAEREEAAEAELLAIREDNHSMMQEIDGLRVERDALAAELAKLREQKPALYMAFSECGQFIRYWTRDTANLDATMAVHDFTVLEFFARPLPAPAIPADHSERNLEKVAPDCRTCANRGQVNGLSQESYCDSCIYQGRDWRQNHFVDAVKRRCEACAILPCSCK